MTQCASNSAGARRSEPLERGMRAFDRLPKRVRERLANCWFNISPLQVASICRQHGEAAALRAIEFTERNIAGRA